MVSDHGRRVVRRFWWLGFGFLALAISTAAQKEHRQPLNEKQIDDIREAGIDPDARIKLYTQFVGEHVETIKGLTPRIHSSARVKRLDDELQDLTALTDELGSNLDQYGERKADMRKALKILSDSTKQWLETLNALPSEPGFNLSRKEAIESQKDLADDAAQMLKEQTEYFKDHKDEKGQERAEPKQ
jgi:chromosome segregation ATPase